MLAGVNGQSKSKKNYIIYRNYLNYKDEQDIQVSK
jgi:hypothetical protein